MFSEGVSCLSCIVFPWYQWADTLHSTLYNRPKINFKNQSPTDLGFLQIILCICHHCWRRRRIERKKSPIQEFVTGLWSAVQRCAQSRSVSFCLCRKSNNSPAGSLTSSGFVFCGLWRSGLFTRTNIWPLVLLQQCEGVTIGQCDTVTV